MIRVTPLAISEVLLIEPLVFGDDRGYFLEAWNREAYGLAGVANHFVQDNVSWSANRVLRGLHLQHPFSQGKLVQALHGEIFDVAVDVRLGSPTFGRWVGERLSEDNHRQLFVPPGFAHGFCVISDHALVSYKATDVYHPASEIAVAWNDPEIGIDWPVTNPRLSAKDGAAPRLSEIPKSRLPGFFD